MLVVTPTLFVCDAWFDVWLSWGTSEGTAAIVTAFAAELPLAVLLASSATTMLRRSARIVHQLRGPAGEPVPLRCPLVVTLPPPPG